MRMPYAAGPAIAVTDRAQVPGDRSLLEVVAGVLEGGAHGVLVRERDLPVAERAVLVHAVGRLCAEHDARLLVASPLPRSAGRCDRSESASIDHIDSGGGRRPGLHLRRDETAPEDVDRPTTLLGRSCHDLTELRRACDDGLDYVTVSPVAQTASKPGHGPALGVSGLRHLVTTIRAACPGAPAVLALGGVDATNAGTWIEAGADGVAVMGALMRAGDPAATMRTIVQSVDLARESTR